MALVKYYIPIFVCYCENICDVLVCCRPKDRDEGSEMEDDHEEEFYYTEVELGLHTSSPPTLSHRDMARPPHEGIVN